MDVTYRDAIRALTMPPVAFIEARPVYQKDRFQMQLGLRPVVNHAPYSGTDRGHLEGAYAIAWMISGFPRIEYATIAETGPVDEETILRLAVEKLSRWLLPSMMPSQTERPQEDPTIRREPLFTELEEAERATAEVPLSPSDAPVTEPASSFAGSLGTPFDGGANANKAQG